MKSVAIILVMLFIVSSSFAETEIMTLLTEEEGALEDAPSSLYEVGRPFNDGPKIQVVTPETNNQYKSPMRITILFVPIDNKDIDLSKLKVEFLKLFTIDLTKRVLPYATKEGINIEKADLPKGKHNIRITIGDSQGGLTQVVITAKII